MDVHTFAPSFFADLLSVWPSFLAAGAAYLGVRIGLNRHEILIEDHTRRLTFVEGATQSAHDRISKIFEDGYYNRNADHDKR